MMYAITVHIGTVSGDMTGSVSVPTFYLDENVQGITGPGMACEVARQIVDPLRLIPAERLRIHAVSVPLTEVSVALGGTSCTVSN